MHHLITNFFVAPSATFIIGSILVFIVLSFWIVFHNNQLYSHLKCFCNCIFIMILVAGCMLAYNLHHDSSSSHVLLRFSALLWRFPHKELRRKLRVSQNMISHVINFLILAGIFTIDSHLQSQAGRYEVRQGMYEKTICSVSWSGLVGHPSSLLEQTTSHCLFWGAHIFDQRQRPKTDDYIICWKCDQVAVGQCLPRVIMFGRHMEVIVFIRHPLTEMFIYHPQIILFSALTPHRSGIFIKIEPKEEKYWSTWIFKPFHVFLQPVSGIMNHISITFLGYRTLHKTFLMCVWKLQGCYE